MPVQPRPLTIRRPPSARKRWLGSAPLINNPKQLTRQHNHFDGLWRFDHYIATRAIRSTSTCGRTTLSASDPISESERLATLPRIPRDEEGPVFAEPWQAQAFALAVQLSAAGYFTWKEWASALANQLKAAADRGEPDDGSHYYDHWLAALEGLVAAKGLADPGALLERKDAWADAYRPTPHGKPVELRAK